MDLRCGNSLNFHIHVVGELRSLDARPCGLRSRKELLVHLVHCREIVHVLEVDIALDDFLPGRACSLQDVAEVNDTLRRMFLDSARDNISILVCWDLSAQEDQTRDLDGVGQDVAEVPVVGRVDLFD